jgi:hypothetical protein
MPQPHARRQWLMVERAARSGTRLTRAHAHCMHAWRRLHARSLDCTCINITPSSSQAEKKIFDAGGDKEYLPIEGFAPFRKATVDLLLGAGHPAIKEVR